jgi:hypothetical protein
MFFFFFFFFGFFSQFHEVWRSSTRGLSQIWLHVRETSKIVFETPNPATCKELESKYGDTISPKKEKEKHCSDPLPVRHVGGETSPAPHSPGIPQSIFLFVAAHNTTHTHTHTQTHARAMFRTTAKKNNSSLNRRRRRGKWRSLDWKENNHKDRLQQ